jgi:hypothetical protein
MNGYWLNGSTTFLGEEARTCRFIPASFIRPNGLYGHTYFGTFTGRVVGNNQAVDPLHAWRLSRGTAVILVIESQADVHGEKDYMNGPVRRPQIYVGAVAHSSLRNSGLSAVLAAKFGFRQLRRNTKELPVYGPVSLSYQQRESCIHEAVEQWHKDQSLSALCGSPYTLSPSHDQCGMLRPFGTSSADWW